MKIIYELNPNNEEGDDRYELYLIQNASKMYNALHDLDSLRRNLYKGYKYYDPKDEEEEEENKYSRIDVELLLADISEIILDSNFSEID